MKIVYDLNEIKYIIREYVQSKYIDMNYTVNNISILVEDDKIEAEVIINEDD